MSELKEIYICLNSEERGPFDSARIDRMLEEGSVRLSDKAWRPGLPDWTTLELALRPAAPVAEPPPAEPATPKQKAFLSYMNIAFSPGLSKEKAALLVNDAMENPADPRRLARWGEDRLRLHPELFAEDLKVRKESRPNTFFDRVQTEGAECFHDVSKAHCQVLVGFLDNKFPNWDADDKEAAWDYFFPALAEKFPQLVNKAWKGRLQYRQGPKVASELTPAAPVRQIVRRPQKGPVPVGAIVFVALLAAGVAGVQYVRKHPDVLKSVTGPATAGHSPSVVFPPASGGASSAPKTGPGSAPAPGAGAAPEGAPAETETGAKEASPSGKGAAPEVAMNAGGTAPAAPADPSMSAPAMAGSTPPADGSPALFSPPPPPAAAPAGGTSTPPPPAAATAPGLPPAPAIPAAGAPRTMAKITAPLAVKTAYGVVTIAPGTALKIISKDANSVRLNYMNQMIVVPITSTDVEP